MEDTTGKLCIIIMTKTFFPIFFPPLAVVQKIDFLFITTAPWRWMTLAPCAVAYVADSLQAVNRLCDGRGFLSVAACSPRTSDPHNKKTPILRLKLSDCLQQ